MPGVRFMTWYLTGLGVMFSRYSDSAGSFADRPLLLTITGLVAFKLLALSNFAFYSQPAAAVDVAMAACLETFVSKWR